MSKCNKRKAVIDDGFNSELVEDAFFDGELEIPCLLKQEPQIIPKQMIPFSQRNRSKDCSEFIAFYEPDVRFHEVLIHPERYVDELRHFPGIVGLDCSLYRDMPLEAQIGNVYRSRAIGDYSKNRGYT